MDNNKNECLKLKGCLGNFTLKTNRVGVVRKKRSAKITQKKKNRKLCMIVFFIWVFWLNKTLDLFFYVYSKNFSFFSFTSNFFGLLVRLNERNKKSKNYDPDSNIYK